MNIINHNGHRPNVLHFHGDNINQLPKTFKYVYDECPVSGYDYSKLAIVSTWTDDDRCWLLKQCNKHYIPLINCVPKDYDKTQPWYMPNKIKFFLETLDNIDQEYVMFLDGYDVLLTGLDDIIQKFEDSKYDIVFGPSCNNYPDVLVDVIPFRTKKGVYRYFNAGCCIGKKESLKKFYRECLNYIDIPNPLQSEQLVIRHAFAKYSSDLNQTFIGVDHECKIFQSMGVLDCNVDYDHKTVTMIPNRIPKKHIIVTGSDGFIGKKLVEKLKEDPDNIVYEIDRKRGLEAKNIDFLFNLKDIDCVYHLAAQTSVFNDQDELIVDDNIATFVKIVGLCRKYGTKLVYASSSTANTSNTTSLYGLSKRFDEEYARLYCSWATGVRLHNVYGKDPREGTLLWCLLNKDVKLYNKGQNKRSFTYIDDAVKGLLWASSTEGGLYNCVNPQTWTTEKFAQEVSNYRDVHYQIVDEIRDKDNPVQDVDKNIETIPLRYTSIEEGVKKSLI